MEEKNTTMGTTETMEDYKEALEASYRRIRAGDIVTGTVIDVNDQDVTIDFNYYAPGRIPVTELSDDPTYHVLENVAVGDTLTATVVKTDDGAGNMLSAFFIWRAETLPNRLIVAAAAALVLIFRWQISMMIYQFVASIFTLVALFVGVVLLCALPFVLIRLFLH